MEKRLTFDGPQRATIAIKIELYPNASLWLRKVGEYRFSSTNILESLIPLSSKNLLKHGLRQ